MKSVTVDLSGQVALVTGASRGIGQACALHLARCGAKVAAVATKLDGLQGTLSQIREKGGEAEGYACNVAEPEEVQKVVDEVQAKFGRIDVLVNNAGVTRDMLLIGMDDDAWDQVIDVNLKGAFLFIRAASRVMLRQRYGRIINMSSIAGLKGNPGQANYSASKAGLIGLTRTVARELAKRNITVNAVAPGFIETDMTGVLPEKVKEEVKKFIPMERMGKVDDIADLVCYLASPGAGYLTGQAIAVDGGMIA